MYTFKDLKRAAKQDAPQNAKVLVILGDSATQFLATAVKGASLLEGFPIRVVDTDYDQLDLQTVDPTSLLYSSQPDYVLLCLCTQKLYDRYCDTPVEERGGFADGQLKKISAYWERISRNSGTVVLQTLFTEYDDGVFGDYAGKVAHSFTYQLRKLNLLLMEAMRESGSVFPVDMCAIAARCGWDAFCPGKFYLSARMAISQDALPEVALHVVRVARSVAGQAKKCLVLDLDNTLWGGVIGDDGMEGIQIGELGDGRAFSAIQRWCKELVRRGVILAICSKNNEDTAKEPFISHPEMILGLDDISIFVANWQDKPSNIRYIQQTLNIGMDSIVFLDDNPFERDAVRSLVPEVTVPELPEDPADWLGFLARLDLFETASYSAGDLERTRQYRQEAQRRVMQDAFESFDDYLESLEMVAEAKPFDEFHAPRISQLTQRSNQFNLRTRRYTEGQIREFAESGEYLTLYFTLADKFGDHGLIGVVIMSRLDEETAFVDTWLMSCRVLKRSMEEFIVNKIMQVAGQAGFKAVEGEYLPTQKNEMVKDIFEDMGFERTGDNRFRAEVESFKCNLNHIREKE